MIIKDEIAFVFKKTEVLKVHLFLKKLKNMGD
jgi:hypothetical protein